MHKCILICASAVLLLSARGDAQTRFMAIEQFGRGWWLKISEQNAAGFLDGYQDCLPNHTERTLAGWSQTTNTLIRKINSFYSRNEHTELDAGQVALKVAAATPGRSPLAGGEIYTNRHGYYDGLWWKGVAADEDLGYVQGYLLCLQYPAARAEAPKIVTAISGWYQAHPSREERAIAHVLEDILKSEKYSNRCRNSTQH